jgi:starvation-inducible DNA-binding protein
MLIELVQQLGVVQATAFSLYLKAHNYHWNVTGPNFKEYHMFLEEVYTAVWESVDDYAEHIRALDAFAMGGLTPFIRVTRIQDAETLIPALAMFKQLEDDNRVLLVELNKTHDLAVEAAAYGVVNFIEGQIDYHDKLHWMLRAFTPAVM